LRGAGASVVTKADVDPNGTPESIHGMAAMYAADNLGHRYASPIAGDFQGLSPLQIAVGTRETLLDDSGRAASKGVEAGGTAELIVE
jgi:acetyl esterase/lipase